MGTHPIFESDFDCLTEPEMSQNSARETGSNRKYSIHHGIAFLTTFITYSFFHAARKTLSNSKDSISIFWTESNFNSTTPAPHETNLTWNRESLASSYEEA